MYRYITVTVIKQLMFKDYQTMSSEWDFIIVIQYVVTDEKWTAENSSGYGWGGKCSLLQWTWKDFGSWMCLDIDLSCDPPWRIKGGNCVGRYSKVFRSSCFDIVMILYDIIIFIQILHQVITWRCYPVFPAVSFGVTFCKGVFRRGRGTQNLIFSNWSQGSNKYGRNQFDRSKIR